MKFSSHKLKLYSFILPALVAFCGMTVGARAQTLNIISGNGQIVGPSFPSPQLLTVQLLNAAGQPFPGQVVNFTASLTFPSGQTNPAAVTTDVNGMASTTFIGASLNGMSTAYTLNQVVASYGNASATFNETTSNFLPSSSSLVVVANVVYPLQGAAAISGPAGSVGAQKIQVVVTPLNGNPFGQSGTGVPNVGLTITTNPGSTGTISCQEGPVVFTDNNGNAFCTPLFGKVGTGTYTITVGGQYIFANNSFQVTVGPPGILSIFSGNNQAGTPGQTLPLPIVAVLTDLGSNAVAGAQVTFTSLTPGGATFTNVNSTSDVNGRVSANVVLGSVPGAIQIQVEDAGNLVRNPAVFTEVVNINVSALTKISGDTQTTFLNSSFGQPLVVQANSPTGQPVSGATVQFSVVGGSGTVNPTSAVTGSNGQASTTVSAGPNAGTVTINATISGITPITFTLTANPPGPINFSYVNAASGAANSLSPGSVATINAQGLVGSSIQGVVGVSEFGPLSYNVAGVSLTLNGTPVPLFNVQNVNGQQSATVQIPFEVPASTVPIVISVAGGGSNNAFVTINPVSPGFFATVQSDGVTRAIALRPNGTVVGPNNPAARGENVRVYLTGLGPVSPAVPTGSFSPQSGSDPVVTYPLVAGINNGGVSIVQAIYARNLIGVYEITITVPAAGTTPTGSNVLSIGVQGPGGYVYSNPSTILLQ